MLYIVKFLHYFIFTYAHSFNKPNNFYSGQGLFVSLCTYLYNHSAKYVQVSISALDFCYRKHSEPIIDRVTLEMVAFLSSPRSEN